MTTDRDTSEVPATREREPTLPLPREADGAVPPGPRRPLGARLRSVPGWLIVAAAVVLLAVSFAAGWAVGNDPGRPRAARPEAARPDAGPLPPTRDARYCGRALDVAAQAIDVYRAALENRIAFAEATFDGDANEIARLDEQLAALSRRAERFEEPVTRALATCPS